MAQATNQTEVTGAEQYEDTQIRKRGRLLFFPITWWETVSSKHLGNEIHIDTTHRIRTVYLNGEPIWKQP